MSTDPLYSFQLPRGLLKAMALFQSTDETRISLFCTCFEIVKAPSGHCSLTLISTDGRRLASYSTEILQETLFGEIPERDVLLLDLNGCAKLPKVELGDCVTVEVFAKHADFIAEKLRYTATRVEAEHGAQFPAWREVIPAGSPESVEQITISHELLADFGKAARLIVGEKGYGLALRTFGMDRAITVQFPSHAQFFGIIMPLKTENPETLPDWVRETIKKPAAKPDSASSKLPLGEEGAQ